MKKAAMLVLALGAALALAPAAPAQDPPQAGTGVAFAKWGDQVLMHGDVVKVTTRDDQKIVGKLVWASDKSKKLFIREKAGAVPRAIAMADIKDIEPAAKPAV